MMIFWDAGLVLLAVPKTGTQALQSALAADADMIIRNPPRQKHMPLRWFQRAILPVFDEQDRARLETVAVVREPLDWLGSWYRYRRRQTLDGSPNSTRAVSFTEFVEAHLSPEPAAFAAVGRQSRFVRTIDGAVGVDHLFAYENQGALISFLEGRLERKIRLRRSNVSPAGDLTLPDTLASRAMRDLQEEYDVHRIAAGASPR